MNRMKKGYPPPHERIGTREARMSDLKAEKLVLERQIHDLTVSYSKDECRQLCAKILTALPRELRDVICAYVVHPDYIWVGPQYLTNEGKPCEKDQDAHFFKESYVGEIMLVELAQAWYRHTLFYFWNKAQNASVVKRFMTTDRWGLDIIPHEHISRVRFDLGSKTLHSAFNCRESHSLCDVDDFPDLLVQPLKSLAQFSIPNRAHFMIRVHTLGSLLEGCFSGKVLGTSRSLLTIVRMYIEEQRVMI